MINLILFIIFLFVLFLCYGSFLNVVAYRLINNKNIIYPSSYCPNCKIAIKVYDLIPVISWLLLKARCRNCKKQISFLYPFIEILTAIIFTCLILFIVPKYWLSYGIFFSALIIVIRTDIETMLISRYTTLALIPIALILSAINLLPINIYQSALGALFGYFILWIFAKIFYLIKKQEGIGEGDFELLATIGAFTDLLGAWLSLFIGAFIGSIIGFYLIFTGSKASTKIPFGPWISIGAILFVFAQEYLAKYLIFLNNFN